MPSSRLCREARPYSWMAAPGRPAVDNFCHRALLRELNPSTIALRLPEAQAFKTITCAIWFKAPFVLVSKLCSLFVLAFEVFEASSFEPVQRRFELLCNPSSPGLTSIYKFHPLTSCLVLSFSLPNFRGQMARRSLCPGAFLSPIDSSVLRRPYAQHPSSFELDLRSKSERAMSECGHECTSVWQALCARGKVQS